ncbi:uncharacterized [Tachysurus ichikawai]
MTKGLVQYRVPNRLEFSGLYREQVLLMDEEMKVLNLHQLHTFTHSQKRYGEFEALRHWFIAAKSHDSPAHVIYIILPLPARQIIGSGAA